MLTSVSLALLQAAALAVLASSVAAFAVEGDGGFTSEQIDCSANKPRITIAVDGAEGYRVYRKVNGSTDWTVVESDITALTYIDDMSSLASGTKYYYKVRAGAAGQYPKVTGEKAKSIRTP